jgi:hypothetical protein
MESKMSSGGPSKTGNTTRRRTGSTFSRTEDRCSKGASPLTNDHITFGDPDFFMPSRLRSPCTSAGPALTYDVTIKIEHLLKHAGLVPHLKRTGCLFVTSAVESVRRSHPRHFRQAPLERGFPARRLTLQGRRADAQPDVRCVHAVDVTRGSRRPVCDLGVGCIY